MRASVNKRKIAFGLLAFFSLFLLLWGGQKIFELESLAKAELAKTKITPEPQLHGQRQDIQCHPLPAINLLSGGYRQLLQRRPILSEQQVHSLPRLAFVISMDVRMYCTYAAVLSASSCYGARHGIPVFVETVQLQTDRHYFQSRTVHIMKYLQHYQWVMHLDADTMFLNASKDARSLLDDSKDLILSQREQGEVFNAGYAVRNSPKGWAFLEHWVSQSDNGVQLANYDNGDLIQTLIQEIDPIKARKCVEHRKISNYVEFVSCAFEMWSNNLPDWVRMYRPWEGFIRSYEPSFPDKYYRSVYEGDFIGHGKHHVDKLTADDIMCTSKPGRSDPDFWEDAGQRWEDLAPVANTSYNSKYLIRSPL